MHYGDLSHSRRCVCFARPRMVVRGLFFASILISSIASAQMHWNVGAASPRELSPTAPKPAGMDESFQTIEEAVRKLNDPRTMANDALRKDGVILHLAPGKHRLTEEIRFGSVAAGGSAIPIAIVGNRDKSTIISGSRPVENWVQVQDARILERLPVSARKNVVQFDLRAEGIRDFGQIIRRGFGQDMSAVGSLELFFRGRPMTLARWPNEGFAKVISAENGDDKSIAFLLDGAHKESLSKEPALVAAGYWGNDWADETIPVASIEAKTGKFILQSPGPRFGIVSGQRVYLENALSELDRPGEWYLDRDTGILYFWPPSRINRGDVEVSQLRSLVVTHGASNLRIADITFEMARGDALALIGGSNIKVDNVTIRNIGGRAANVGGFNHIFSNVDIYDVGEGGIYLWGGDRSNLKAANLSVEFSRFRRFNRLARTYRPAIQLGGVGNSALGNVISEGTHNAIVFIGNNHTIAFNEISRVGLETGDIGAIYSGNDWTARGTVIRNNYLHDIHGPGLHGSRGVYLDDQTSGIFIRENLFVRVDRPVFIGGGRDNIVEGNVMVSSSPGIHVDARGLNWQRSKTNDEKGILRKRLKEVPFDRGPYREQYPRLASILNDEPGAPKNNLILNNVVLDGQSVEFSEGADRWLTGEEVISASKIKFREGSRVLRAERATDFVIDQIAPTPGRELSPLPLKGMDCVSNRWRQLDTGKDLEICHLQ